MRTRNLILLAIGLCSLFGLGGAYLVTTERAIHETNGSNEMRSLDEEPNGNIIVVYRQDSTFEEQSELSRRVISPWKKGPGFTHESGVLSLIGLRDIDGKVTQKLFFAVSATESEKEWLRMGLQASPIVYRYFENMSEGEVRNVLERRGSNKPQEKK